MAELKIIEEKQNPLFDRKEVQIEINAEITPSHEEAEKLLSDKFSTPVENIKIKKIGGKFGSKDFLISANIYKTKEDKNSTEQKTKQEKEAEKKAAEEAAKVAAEAKAKKAEEAKAQAEAKKKAAEEAAKATETPAEEIKSEEEVKSE